MKPRYLFDLTTTAKNKGRMTGIPRSEFSLAKALLELLGDELAFVVYSSVRGNFYPVPLDCLDHASCKKLLESIDSTDQAFSPAAYASQNGTPFTMFTCGYSWNLHPDYTESLVRFVRTHRGKLCVMIHDLIPYLFPYWIDPANVLKFNSSLSILSQQTDLVACISRNTQRDFLAFCETEGLTAAESVAIRLGDQPDSSFDSYFWKEHETSSMVIDPPFVLAVGAIQQRKNYQLLYAAWQKLIRAKFAVPKLVIVGGCVAGGHEILRMFLEDREIARHVAIMPNVSDRQLESLYQKALFTLYPSSYEGWGLPVCESFRLGKICLASDHSSLPEIFPGYPELLSANNADLWAARIAHFTSDAPARLELESFIKQNYRPHSWKDTARDLRDCLRDLAESGTPDRSQLRPSKLEVGKRVDFSQLQSSIYPSTGWKEHESWGRWARGPRAGISLVIDSNHVDEELYLIVKMKCSRAQAVNIHVNGELRETCHVGTDLEKFLCLLTKQDLSSANLDIVLETVGQSSKPVAAMRSVVGISQLGIERLSSLKHQSSTAGRPRRGRWLLSENRYSVMLGERGSNETWTGLFPAAGFAPTLHGRDHGERESLTPGERLQESHERYLDTARRARECEKLLRKLPRQIQYRLGTALVRAIDHPAELLVTPWRVAMLLIEALRGRAARRDQTHIDVRHRNGKIGLPRRSSGQQRLTVNPIRAATVWLNCVFSGPQDQHGKFVVRVNGRIVQRINTRTKTFQLIKVDLGDVVGGRPANVSIELEALPRGDDQQRRVDIVEALVDQEDFVLISTRKVEPVTIPLNEPVLFGAETAAETYGFLGFGWQHYDRDGVNSTGSCCELEFFLPNPVVQPEFAISLKCDANAASAATGIGSRLCALIGKPFLPKRTVRISVNDKPLGTAAVSRSKFETVRISCPNSLDGSVALRLEIDKAYRGEHLTIRDLSVHSS